MFKETKNSAIGDIPPDKDKEQEKITVRMLIVDDEILYRKSLLFGLKFNVDKDGFTSVVDEVDNLENALSQLEQNEYEVVITDGMFPERSGSYVDSSYNEKDFRGNQIIKAAKDKGVKLVIGLSAEPQYFKQADMVFQKPVEIANLKAAIKKAVEDEINDN